MQEEYVHLFSIQAQALPQALNICLFECRVTLQVVERGRAQSADANNLAAKPGK